MTCSLADISRAAASTFDAFVDDPLTKYLLAVIFLVHTPPLSTIIDISKLQDAKLSPIIFKAVNRLCFMQWRRTKVVLTVDAGAAVVVACVLKQ